MKIKRLIVINIVILILLFLFTTVTSLNPKGEILERKPTFEWLGLPTGYVIMIDDNPDFTTPTTVEVKGNKYSPENELELGEHYWKVKGLRESEVQKFTIVSKVSLKREEDENLRNDGNTRLKLGIISGVTGAVTLDINQTIKLEKEVEEVSAKQDE